MNNFQPKNRRDEGLSYLYRKALGPAKDSGGRDVEKVIDLELYYSKGGGNAWSGSNEPRGLWVSVIPKELGDGFESFQLTGGKGRRFHVLTLKRKNDKELARVAEMLDMIAPAVVFRFENDDTAGAARLIEAALVPEPVPVAVKGLDTDRLYKELTGRDYVPGVPATDFMSGAADMAGLSAALEKFVTAPIDPNGEANSYGVRCPECGQWVTRCSCDDSEDPTSAEHTPAKQAAQDEALRAIGATNNSAELEARRVKSREEFEAWDAAEAAANIAAGLHVDTPADEREAAQKGPDFLFSGSGTVYLCTPQNEGARAHLEEHVEDSAQWLGKGLAVEHRYVESLILALVDAGYTVGHS